MTKMNIIACVAAIAITTISARSESLEPIRQNCTISAGDKPGSFRLQTGKGRCQDRKTCGGGMSEELSSRFTGISVADLCRQGAQLTVTLSAEAGTFTCTGTVQDGVLAGNSIFTPDPAFVARMQQMGFSGYDSNKLLAYAFLNVESSWARSIMDIGIQGLNSENLIALRVFNLDPDYVRSIAALGYAVPTADNLVALKSQGVDPADVRNIRALGYQPTLDELIQMRIFKITPEFIHRMEARGLKDLTISKLVQIRIFNLAD